MDARYALTLTNFFPEADRITVRRGYSSHATDMTDPVESVIAWRGPSGVKLLAATETDIWDATNSGTASSLYGSASSGRWQDLNYTTAGGHFSLLFNGADSPLKYDGSSVSSNSISGTGLTSSNLISAFSHMSRVWMIEKDSMNAWYLATDAISGSASKFPLGAVFKDGGYLAAGGTYSTDAGAGMDDFAAFISSTGEVLVYQGTDPSSASTWSLVGRYKTGAPLGRRCVANLGGDLLILTEIGVVSLKAIINYDRAQAQYASVSDKIDRLLSEDARNYKSNFGWQIMVHPKAKWLVVNVPVSENESQFQYIMNTTTGAWCDFDGFNANCFASTVDEIYFGGNSGTAWKADNAYQDNSSKITADVKSAYNYFDSRGTLKHFHMLHPVISSTGEPSISLGASIDFDEVEPSGDLTPTAIGVAVWDSAVWDADVWAGLSKVTKGWTSISGVGMCMATLARISIRGGACSVNSFDIVANPGGTV